MYKMLLAWRYLRTRYIALASVISVTLGVATLIIVNSVMTGFTREMEDRLNGMLSDVVIESHDVLGMPDPEAHIKVVREVLGQDLAGITATVHVPAMATLEANGHFLTRQITFIGVDEKTYASVSDFGRNLLHPENRRQLSFDLRDEGYAPGRRDFPSPAGWPYRRDKAEMDRITRAAMQQHADENVGLPADPTAARPADAASSGDADPAAEVNLFDAAREQHPGIILGIAMCTLRERDPKNNDVRERFLIRPGDDVQITFPKCSIPVQPESARFTVVDFFESKMSEYDSTFAFVPLAEMQRIRAMFDEDTQTHTVTALQVKLRPGASLNDARDRLQARFPISHFRYSIRTWRDMQGPLLSAVQLETTILNVLLFLIIAVAGFGILATFFMIVVEKTRDIGVLKSLGAPSGGVMSIFLGYGLSLGIVGAGVGTLLGLIFVHYINEVAGVVEKLTGREVFDPTVYYFTEIPAHVEPLTVVWVVLGSVGIAVLASVLPAFRAARLHPVEALRYE